MLAFALAAALAAPAVAFAAPAPAAGAWTPGATEQRPAATGSFSPEAVTRYTAGYREFIGAARVPHQRVAALVKRAEAQGFKPFTASSAWKPGAKYYVLNRGRSAAFFVVGQERLERGMRLVAAHVDSPRLDLRIRPLKASENLLVLRAQAYGGIKRYQWANLPLALVGQAARADGKVVDVSIGLAPGDPVFMLPDLSPHVDKPNRNRSMDQVFVGDELSVIGAHALGGADAPKKAFMRELGRRYDLSEEDFVSAELALVPATPPLDVGLDRGLLAAYGHDDGLCTYASVEALGTLSRAPSRTAVAYLVDHEEVGNVNATGVNSRFLTGLIERMLDAEGKGGDAPSRYAAVGEVLERSEALSADVSQAINPLFPGVEDAQTTARLGAGFTLKTMGPGLSGDVGFLGRLRGLMAKQNLPWQTYAYKPDSGGGKTIGSSLQELNMDVVDVGAPLLAMHGTLELCAKSDAYGLYRLFDAFYAP